MSAPIPFGPFLFDPDLGRLTRNGAGIALNTKGAVLLGTLLGAKGQPVTKADLMDRAWPGIVVEEGNLTVQIAALRKALGAAPGGDWIATVPRVGYRMVLPAVTSAQPLRRPTLVILPFHNPGAQADDDYFVSGVAEDIVMGLSRFASFAVISRIADATYRDPLNDARSIGAELGAAYILGGSLRRAGGRIRLTAQLVDCTSDITLWADKFEGVTEDIFAIQDQITETVVTRIEPHIDRAEIERSRVQRPQSLAGYDIHLQARSMIQVGSPSGSAEGFALLQRGLVSEPDNPLLLADAAWALEHRLTMGWPRIGLDDAALCGELARRGLEFADVDAVTIAICGIALLQGARDYAVGMKAVADAYRVNPYNHIIICTAAVAQVHCGSVAAAQELYTRAIRLNPDHGYVHLAHAGLAHIDVIRGEYDAAIGHAALAAALAPV